MRTRVAWYMRRWLHARARQGSGRGATRLRFQHFAQAQAIQHLHAATPRALAMVSAAGVLCTGWASQHRWDWDAPAQCEALAQHDTDTSQRGFEDEYETKTLVGCGTFGMVMQCARRKDGQVAAVKVIQDLADMREEAEREKLALAWIQQHGGHENIVHFDGAYEENGFHYIVTEFVDGESLFQWLKKNRQLDVWTALSITTQIVSALAFLREHGLVHRDLKPENIMLVPQDKDSDAPWQVKLIDFGSADFVSSDHPEVAGNAITCTSGTRCYWPPEVLLRQEVSPAMDMWALGCLLFIMLTGRHPFDLMGASTEDEIVARITTEKVSFLNPVWRDVPESIKMLIKGLLEKDPAQRLTVHEASAIIESIDDKLHIV